MDGNRDGRRCLRSLIAIYGLELTDYFMCVADTHGTANATDKLNRLRVIVLNQMAGLCVPQVPKCLHLPSRACFGREEQQERARIEAEIKSYQECGQQQQVQHRQELLQQQLHQL
jgi:hypothetical protein